MEDFKNNVEQGVVKLTPTEWLKELAEEFKKNEHFKDLSNDEILACFCVQTFLESYEEGYSPEEVAYNELSCGD